MALKDLLQSLQQGIVQSQERRAASSDFLNQYLTSQQQASSLSMGPGGGPGEALGGLSPISSGSEGPTGPLPGGGNKNFQAFYKAISQQESGGNYKAVGVPTKSGRAYGKYQILDSNFVGPGGWDKEALGRDITLQQYLNQPKLQEAIARSKLHTYFKQYGAAGAAKAWYAGPGNAKTNSNSPQYGGPSINAYASSVLNHMKKYL